MGTDRTNGNLNHHHRSKWRGDEHDTGDKRRRGEYHAGGERRWGSEWAGNTNNGAAGAGATGAGVAP